MDGFYVYIHGFSLSLPPLFYVFPPAGDDLCQIVICPYPMAFVPSNCSFAVNATRRLSKGVSHEAAAE
jgi:hypothetical protein